MEHTLHSVQRILEEITKFALHELPSVDALSIRTKRDAADLVSNRDYVMEAKIIEVIHRIFPDHVVTSEEVGTVGNENSQHQWFIDPIDGSCNDSHGVPWSCVSVAYVEEDKTLAGLVVNPHTGEVFQAIYEHGATLNNQRIEVSNTGSLSGEVVMTELLNQRPWGGMSGFIEFLAGQDATVRIMGSTALSICQVAAGRVAATVLADAGLLDVAAAVLIAQEAGATVVQNGLEMRGLPHGEMIIGRDDVVHQLNKAVFKHDGHKH